MKEAVVSGVVIFSSTPEERHEQVTFLNEGLQKGWLKPASWKVLELENVVKAHTEIMENKGAKGQIALKIEE